VGGGPLGTHPGPLTYLLNYLLTYLQTR